MDPWLRLEAGANVSPLQGWNGDPRAWVIESRLRCGE